MKREFIVAATASIILCSIAGAAEIKVLASGATKEAYVELIPEFEKSSGHKVVTTWTGSANIKKQIAAGEVYDLVIVGGPVIDAFIQQSKVVPGSRVDLMKSGVGVGVRAGAPKPDISSSEALKKTVLAAKSIGYSTGPSGAYVVSLFERMGIADQMKNKIVYRTQGSEVADAVAKGDAELGISFIAELAPNKGVKIAGPLPDAIQSPTDYVAAVLSVSANADAARAFVQSMASPAGGAVFKAAGLTVLSPAH